MSAPNSSLPSSSSGYGIQPQHNTTSDRINVDYETLESKDFGEIITNLVVTKSMILKDRTNYILWHQALVNAIRYVDAGLYDYMMSSQSDNPIYEMVVEMLLIRYVSKEIFDQYKIDGLFGKDIYLEIVERYGHMSNHDKINYAIKLNQKAQLKSVSVLKSIEYMKEWNNYSQTLNETERQALEQLMRINESNPSFVEKFLNLNEPKLSLDGIEDFIERFPIYKQNKKQQDEEIQSESVMKINSKLENKSKVNGNSEIYKINCHRCFGLGHTSKNCGSPDRVGFIPDLETRLLYWKGKRRKMDE